MAKQAMRLPLRHGDRRKRYLNRASIHKRLLESIRTHPGLSAVQLSKLLNEPAASVSSVLTRMMRAGFLVRSANLGPRYGYVYYLSKKGSKKMPIDNQMRKELDEEIEKQRSETEEPKAKALLLIAKILLANTPTEK